MWFLGPRGICRRQGKENSFSHCFSFTSDHCSSSALDPSAPLVGEAKRVKWSKTRETYHPNIIFSTAVLSSFRPYEHSALIFSISTEGLQSVVGDVGQFSGSEQQDSSFMFTFIFSLASSTYRYVFTLLFMVF